jgi:Ca-activated chloride channel family protein
MQEGNRVAIARAAAESIRRSLSPQDRIGVVQFSGGVVHHLTVDHNPPDSDSVRRSIDGLRPRGSTNVQAGMDLGVQMADQARRQRPDAHNYIILMSDGVANVDATDPFAILESASDRDSGNPLRLITIGVGISNYNDYLLEQLAQYGNGWYRYLSTTAQARATFSRENWLALSVPFADQTRAQVTWDPAMVASWRLIGYENRVTSDESFTENRKEFAEIPVGAATTVFYEIELTHEGEWAASNFAQLGDVALRWVTPSDGTSNRQQGTILADLSSGTDPLMRFGAVVALASDRYSSLPYIDGTDSAYVRHELSTLMEELWPLESDLGRLDSYRDFKFLLRHITDSLPESIGSTQPSGYSP